MAQTPTERITGIERIMDTHTFRLDAAATELDAVYEAQRELEKDHGALKRDFDRELALLKREIEELSSWR